MNINPIGTVDCDFKEKFGIPRQPGLSPHSKAKIIMPKNRFNEEAIQDLEGSSHLWVIFHFNQLKKTPDNPRVRPPRLGGNQYVGVFSSRSPYRPNPIGLSLVSFSHIHITKTSIEVHISNHDLLHGTPVLDLKPFVEADLPASEVKYSWQNNEWEYLNVDFSIEAEDFLRDNKCLKEQIIEILRNDPRPAYHKKHKKKKINGLTLGDHNIKFSIDEIDCLVLTITRLK